MACLAPLNRVGNAIAQNPVVARARNYSIQLPGVFIGFTDHLDKIVKLVEGLFAGFEHLFEMTPITSAARAFLNVSTKWLSSTLFMRDFKFWTETKKDGSFAFANAFKKDPYQLLSIASYHVGHFFTAFKLAKDLGVTAFSKLDSALGHVAIFGAQLSLKLIKDASVIIGGAFGIASFFRAFLFDQNGNPRMNHFQLLRQGRFGEIVSEDKAISLVNNVSKIYVVSAVAMGTAFSWTFFWMGLALGVSNAWKYAIKFEGQDRAQLAAYNERLPIYEQIPIARAQTAPAA